MKMTKKFLSLLLSVLMLLGSCIVAFADSDSADTVIEKSVSLWDLSPLTEGSSALPAGAAITSSEYNGTKSVVEADGEKAYKVSFDIANTVGDSTNLSGTKKIWFTADIPSGYAKYIKSVSAELQNTANANFMYELGVTDGTTYSKAGDNGRQFAAGSSSTKTFYVANLYKASTNQIVWYSSHTALKDNGYWDSASIASATKVFFCLGIPTVTGEEGYYALIKNISITLSGTEAELDAAMNASKYAWKTLYDFEDGNVGTIGTDANAYAVTGTDKASSGNGAFFFQNTNKSQNWGDQDKWIPLDSYVVNATGVSFWVNNLGDTAQTVKFLVSGDNNVNYGQQNFSIPSKQYVKCYVDFRNLGTAGDKYGDLSHSGVSLTKEQISGIKRIIFQPIKNSNTEEAHPGFYIDDIKYETDTEHVYSKTLSLDSYTVSGATGEYSDGKLVVTPESTENAAKASVSVNVPEKFFEGATSITYSYTNTTSNTFKTRLAVKGINDEGVSKYWKWGEDTSENVGASLTKTRYFNIADTSKDGGAHLFENDGSHLENSVGQWGNVWSSANNPPSPSERTGLTSLELRIFDFVGDGTFTINSVTVTYAGNKLSSDSTVENGKISFDRSSFVFAGDTTGFSLVPNEGCVYVPGTLNVKVSDNSDLKLNYDTEDGTLNSSVGQHYSFTMPDADITVYAMFVEADKLDETLANLQKMRSIVYNFEDGNIGNITKSSNTYVVEGTDKASSGSGALFFQNTAVKAYEDKDLHIPVNSYVADATGISFWVYNLGSAQTVKVKVNASGTELGHKVFSIPSKSYVKCFIDFKELGAAGDTYGALGNSGVSLTAKQIRSISEINFYPLKNNTESHPGFYIDDITYEYDSEHVYTKTVPFDDVTFSDGANATVTEDGKIVFTPTETATTVKASINVPEKFFAGASTVTFNLSNGVASSFKLGALVNGTNDNGDSGYWWKWGNEKHFKDFGASTEASFTKSFSGGSGGEDMIFESKDSYYITNYYQKGTNAPSSSEKASITSLDFRIFDFAGTEGTFTINSVTVTYGGNKLSSDSTITNGSVKFDRSNVFAGDTAGFTLIPNEDYDYVPNTLKVVATDGTVIDTTKRYAFREGNVGYHYEFTMPEADVTVYAEFDSTSSMTITPTADEKAESVKFDFKVALNGNGKVTIDGEEREIVSVGAIVTTNEVLEKFGYTDWDSATRELAASDSAVAKYIDDINIGTNGLKYDEAHEFIRYNVIINNLTKKAMNGLFLARGYIEYKDSDGNIAIEYTNETICYSEEIYGGFYSFNADITKGISYSGVFETTAATVSASNKIFDIATFEDIAAQGFKHVRLPVNFSAHTDDSTADYVLNEKFMQQLDTVVKNAIKSGLTIIIDFHQACSLNGTSIYTDYETVSPKFFKIWEQVSERYKNYPDLVAFELINEPNLAKASLMELQENALDIIRKSNPTRKVFVAGGANNEPNTLANISNKLKKDGNTVAAVHCYYPMEFTHQGAEWTDLKDSTGVTFTDAMKTQVDSAIQTCKKFEQTSGMQVWMGEFGVYQKAAASEAQTYLTYFTNACKNSGIDWCYWEYNQGFGAYSESAGVWKDHVLTGLGLK